MVDDIHWRLASDGSKKGVLLAGASAHESMHLVDGLAQGRIIARCSKQGHAVLVEKLSRSIREKDGGAFKLLCCGADALGTFRCQQALGRKVECLGHGFTLSRL